LGEQRYDVSRSTRVGIFFDAMDRADSLGITPVRDSAGELSFTFTSSTYIQAPLDLTNYVSSTEPAVLMTHDPNASTTFFCFLPGRHVGVAEGGACKEVRLARVMFFKMDGDIDPAIWGSLN